MYAPSTCCFPCLEVRICHYGVSGAFPENLEDGIREKKGDLCRAYGFIDFGWLCF